MAIFFCSYRKAQVAFLQSNKSINFHFGVNTKIVEAGATSKSIIDYKLSRYC